MNRFCKLALKVKATPFPAYSKQIVKPEVANQTEDGRTKMQFSIELWLWIQYKNKQKNFTVS